MPAKKRMPVWASYDDPDEEQVKTREGKQIYAKFDKTWDCIIQSKPPRLKPESEMKRIFDFCCDCVESLTTHVSAMMRY